MLMCLTYISKTSFGSCFYPYLVTSSESEQVLISTSISMGDACTFKTYNQLFYNMG